MGDSQTCRKSRIRAKIGFVLRSIDQAEQLVDALLGSAVGANKFWCNNRIHIFNRTHDSLTEPSFLVAVPQFDCFVLAC